MKSPALAPLFAMAASFSVPAQAQTPDPPKETPATAEAPAPSPPAKVPQDPNPRKLAGSLSGDTGVLRLGSASGLQPGTFRVSLGLDFFAADGFLRDGDAASRFGGLLGFAGSPIDYLELWLNVGLASTRSDFTEPNLLQSQGDLTFGAKGFYPFSDIFSAGVDLSVRALTALDDTGYGAAQVRARVLGTLDLQGLDSPIPLRAHLNFGYLYDGSEDLVSEARGLALPEQFALGVSEFDRLVAGLAIEVPVQWVTPYLEYTIEIPLGYTSVPGIVVETSFAPKQTVEPVRESLARVMPQRLTPGVRLHRFDPFFFDVAVEIGLTPDDNVGVPPVPPYNVVFLASYVLDPFGLRGGRAKTGPAEAVSVPVLVPTDDGPGAELAGIVLNKDTQEPVSDAIIRFDRAPPVATDPDGKFRSPTMEPGPLQVTIEKNGFDPGQATLELADRGTLEIAVELEPAALPGQVVGTVEGPGGPLADVAIRLVGPTSTEARTGPDGRFEIRVEPGSYRVVATPAGYLARGAVITVTKDAPAELRLRLSNQSSEATVEDDRLRVGAPMVFGPEETVLTNEIRDQLALAADFLLRNPETQIQVEGHTDNRGDTETLVQRSRERAEAVVEFLASLGVSKDRLSVQAFGPERPVAPNLTRRGRVQNNRVELRITQNRDT